MGLFFAKLKDYVDSFGLLGQNNGDGGDAMNFEGILYTLYKAFGLKNDIIRSNDPIELSITETAEKLIDEDGRGRRHPDEEKWYGDFLRLSRDQFKVFVVGLAVNGATDVLLKVMKHHFFGTFKYKVKWIGVTLTVPRMGVWMHNTKHNFQYKTLEEHKEKSTPDVEWNYEDKWPDFTGPIFWAIYIRAFFEPIAIVMGVITLIGGLAGSGWPLLVASIPLVILLLGDLQLYIDTLLNIKDKNDDTNHIITLAHVKLMNVVSPLANHARDLYFEKADYETALDYHFRPESNNPPLGSIIKEAIKKGKI